MVRNGKEETAIPLMENENALVEVTSQSREYKLIIFSHKNLMNMYKQIQMRMYNEESEILRKS